MSLTPFSSFEVNPRSTRQTIFVVFFSVFYPQNAGWKVWIIKNLNNYYFLIQSYKSHAENLLQKLNSQRICGIFVDSSLLSRTGEVVFYHSAILNGNFSRENLFYDFSNFIFHRYSSDNCRSVLARDSESLFRICLSGSNLEWREYQNIPRALESRKTAQIEEPPKCSPPVDRRRWRIQSIKKEKQISYFAQRKGIFCTLELM